MEDPSNNTITIFLIVLIFLSAFFSSSETAFSSLSKIRIKNYISDGNKKAKKTLLLTENYDSLISVILIGNNIVNILTASLSTILFTNLFGSQGVAISTFVITILLLIFGEIIPKSLAKKSPEIIAIRFTNILWILVTLFAPISKFFKFLKKSLKKDNSNKNLNLPSVTETELKHIINEIQNEGVLEQEESNLVKSALDFDDILAEEILTPRVDIIGIEENFSIGKVKDIFFEYKFSRLPVYKDNIDNIIGIINRAEFFTLLIKNINFKISDIIQKTIHIAPQTLISELMVLLKSNKIHMAVVTDQFGGTIGIITLEDILEELVGEIWDEDDDIIENITFISENVLKVSGDTNIYDFFDVIEYDYKNFDKPINTVNGLIMDILGKLPVGGEIFNFNGLECKVENIVNKKICNLIVTKNTEKNNNEE